jgi:hypothetical protein
MRLREVFATGRKKGNSRAGPDQGTGGGGAPARSFRLFFRRIFLPSMRRVPAEANDVKSSNSGVSWLHENGGDDPGVSPEISITNS